jgi:hypothetical protein
MRNLVPNGVKAKDYTNLLAITRVIDKLFRIATKEDAFEENPWKDIAGYALLAMRNRKLKPGDIQWVKKGTLS